MGLDRPRVFHLITRLLKGGAEAKTLATVLGLNEYEFTVGYGASYEEEQVVELKNAGISTKRFPLIRHYNPVAALAAVPAIALYLRRREFDIVHTHSTEAGIIGRFAAAAAGVPHVVHTVHGVPFAPDRHTLINRFVLQCERIAASHTDRIISNADAISHEYIARNIGYPEQYTTVYSGIDLAQFQDSSPASDIDGTGTKILMVGRLVEGKGIEDLLLALNRIERIDFSVFIAGDGPLLDRLKTKVDHTELIDSVTFLGHRDDVPAIMAACDVFALPSYREGTPRVITEAMASGLPVIATNIAGIPEQIEDGKNGYLIEPGDIDTLKDRLEKLCTSEVLREKLGSAGRKRAEKFSVMQMLEDLDNVYREILHSPADVG